MWYYVVFSANENRPLTAAYFVYVCSSGTPDSSPSIRAPSKPILLVSYPLAERYSLNLMSSWSIVSCPMWGSSNTKAAARKASDDATKKGFRPAAISSLPAAFWIASSA